MAPESMHPDGRPSPVTLFSELHTHCRHIVCYIDGDQNGLPFSIVIGQASLNQQPEPLALQFEKFLDPHAIAKPLAGLISLTAPLDLFGFIPPKDNAGIPGIVWPWTNRYQTALSRVPLARQLLFDQYGRPLPDISVKQLYIARHRGLLWHDTKAFTGWFLGHWRRWEPRQQDAS